jgi:ABC-type phosphate transport system permease subunit
MPSTSRSAVLTVVGAVACVVGIVGYVVFGWRFGGGTDPVAVAVALGCVALAVGSYVLDR